MTFSVSENAWAEAKAYFAANPHAVKLKKATPSDHSFIKFENGEILALAREKELQEGLIGEGHFSKVKEAINQHAQIFAVKILGCKSGFEPFFNFGAWHKVKIFISSVWRQLKNDKPNAEKKPQRKLYLLTEFIKGVPLSTYVEQQDSAPKIYEPATLLIALECCMALYRLHQLRIIHRDIKPSNIMVSYINQRLAIQFIDFDFSLVLAEDCSFVEIKRAMICKDYAPPEVLEHSRFSFSSDIFSLGKVFSELNLTEVATMLTGFYPEERSALPTAIFSIMEKFFKLNLPIDDNVKETFNRAIHLIQHQYHGIFSAGATCEILFEHFRRNNALSEVLKIFAVREVKNFKGDYINLSKHPTTPRAPCTLHDPLPAKSFLPLRDSQQEALNAAMQAFTLNTPLRQEIETGNASLSM